MTFKRKTKLNLLGIDTGGTFTDFVYVHAGGIRIHKVLSTPAAPDRAILQGIREMGIELQDLRIVHGSTVATNAVLEGKGARTVYIANYGLKDVLTIGRQARQELYNLQPYKCPPPVPYELCLETGGRLAADGSVVETLTDTDLEVLLEQIKSLKPEAVAINLLFSFLDGRFERRIAEVLPDDIFVSCSHEVLPEYREYERGITTWLNAYVGPLVQGYLRKLNAAVAPARVSVMQSSANTCNTKQAGQGAVHLLLSGPAGGLNGARYVSGLMGEKRLLTFDMGGTSTDVAMIDGQIMLTNQGHIGRYPVGVPMVDMHTIGAGGGSIAAVDAGGLLKVGPESAGAIPGPACYGQDGLLPTVTDANLVLGHLPRAARLGGSMKLDYGQAYQAVASLTEPLGLGSVEEAAVGIIRIANENMAQALRVISVQRGIDPREFALVAFGGAGGLHVCALAEILGITRAIAPIQAGVLSALGMLVASPGRQLSRTLALILSHCSSDYIQGVLDELATLGRNALQQEGHDPESIHCEASLDVCYKGQSSTLNLPWTDPGMVEQAFHELHEGLYGHRLDALVELTNVRLSVTTPPHSISLPRHAGTEITEDHHSNIYGEEGDVCVFQRSALAADQIVAGPAIIMDAISTVFVDQGWQCQTDTLGNLLLRHNP